MAVKIGLVGTGTVGGGCIELLKKHAADYKTRYGLDVELARVCSKEPQQAEEHGVKDIFTEEYTDIVNDPDIDIVIELVGGTTIAKKIVCEALEAGKHVVTANKALLATYGEEIEELAAKNNCKLQYEASVGGGIPIIGPLKHSLNASEITSILGIVNGTTNYMLTRMAAEGISYDEVLADAQAKGYAEADPTADVDGLDAAAKIAILASIAFNTRVTIDQVTCEGIRTITPADLAAAKDMGYCVKLLAVANRTDEGIEVRVPPAMVPLDHQLASVDGVFNAIYVVGDFIGPTMYFGQGAGSDPTASAVIGDVLELVNYIQAGTGMLAGNTYTDNLPLVSTDDLVTRAYIRFQVAERPGVLAAMSAVFAEYGVSVHSVIQRGVATEEADSVELVYVTHSAREADLRATLDGIAKLDNVLVGPEPTLIRVIK